MLANFLRKSTPAHFIYLIVLLLAYFVLTVYPEFSAGFQLGLVLEKLTFFTGLVFLLAVTVFVIRKNELSKDSAYALFFSVVLLGSFNESLKNDSFLIAAIFILLASRKIYSLKNYKRTLAKVFDASLWLAVGFLYFEWTALFLIVLYGGLFNFKLLDWRTVLTPILGFGSVIFIFFTYHFLFSNTTEFYEIFNFEYALNLEAFKSVKLAMPLIFYVGMAFLAMVVLIPKVLAGSNNFTRSWNTLVLQFLIGILIIVITPNKNGSSIYFVLLPLPIIFANYLEILNSKWVKNILLYAALLISLLPYLL